ncbi:MAG: hypothetical protein ACI3U8_00245 [Candidatus Onthomonas sp.]
MRTAIMTVVTLLISFLLVGGCVQMVEESGSDISGGLVFFLLLIAGFFIAVFLDTMFKGKK